MRILHVLSQTELTGAEVYAVTLGEYQKREGHDVTIVSDKLHVPTGLPVLYRPISKRSWSQRLKNIFWLKKIIREKGIDIVHGHSRASCWVSFWATRGTRTAFVSTVHGRQHLHFSLKLYSVYGDRVVAICKSVRDHLVGELGIRSNRVSVIANGFSFDKELAQPLPPSPQVFLIARTSGPKGKRSGYLVRNIFPRLLEKYSNLEISIAGGPLANFDEKTIEALNEMKLRFGARIKAREYISRELAEQLISKSSLVIASGRLAIRALSQGRALLGMGEASAVGLINPGNLDSGIETNFGDILPDASEAVDYSFVEKEIEAFLDSPMNADPAVVKKVRETYDIERVGRAISSVYFEALLDRRVPKRVPVLMYHKVVRPDYSSVHKTYVFEKTFETHLWALKAMGYSTVTFEDIAGAALAGKELPRKPVVLTFDDGYKKSIERAIPLLRKFGFRAVFYVLGDPQITKNVWDPEDEESELLSAEEIRWLKSLSMEVGAHSMSHRKLSELSEQEMEIEVYQSKAKLEELLGSEVLSFAYPFGNLCGKTKKAVKLHGFKFALATDSGGLTLSEEPFQIFRASVFPRDGFWSIRKKASRWYRLYYALKRQRSQTGMEPPSSSSSSSPISEASMAP